jgi:hypothetical protein
MRLISYGPIFAVLLTLTGCGILSKPEPKILTVTNTVKTTVPIVARPKAVNLNDVKIYVVTKENIDQFEQDFAKKNGSLVYIAISIKDYENLSLNFAELRRYIEQQQQIIVYYEEAVKPEESKPQEK